MVSKQAVLAEWRRGATSVITSLAMVGPRWHAHCGSYSHPIPLPPPPSAGATGLSICNRVHAAQAATPATAGFVDPLGNSPLTIAVEGGNGEAVTALLAKVPAPPLAGAILTAATFNRPQLIPVLVRHGADVRETDVSGRRGGL